MSTYVNTVNQTEIFAEGRGDMGLRCSARPTCCVLARNADGRQQAAARGAERAGTLQPEDGAARVQLPQPRCGAARASSAIDLHNNDLFKGYDYNAMIRATSDGANAHDPRYGMEDLFEAYAGTYR